LRDIPDVDAPHFTPQDNDILEKLIQMAALLVEN